MQHAPRPPAHACGTVASPASASPRSTAASACRRRVPARVQPRCVRRTRCPSICRCPRSCRAPRCCSTSATRTAEAPPPGDAARRRDLDAVPVRAERRLRRRRRAHHRGARRRRVGGERLEDLDERRVGGRLRPVPAAHQLGRAQAPRPHRVRRADPPRRHRAAPHRDDRRSVASSARSSSPTCASPTTTAWATSTTAGRSARRWMFHERNAMGGGSPYTSGNRLQRGRHRERGRQVRAAGPRAAGRSTTPASVTSSASRAAAPRVGTALTHARRRGHATGASSPTPTRRSPGSCTR